MTFKDRLEAGSALAARLKRFSRPLVLAIPRGAVPMAEVIARELGGDLDVILVHKFGFPDNPEFALGSVSESGDIHLGVGAERYGLGLSDVSAWASSEIAALKRKREFFTPHGEPLPFTDRDVIIVDDGIATGATATAAVRAVRSSGARSITVATPVASNEAVLRLQAEGAAVEALLVPEHFHSVGAFFEDFSQVTDEQVIEILRGRQRDVEILLGRSAREAVSLRAFLTVPTRAMGLVIFAHGSGSGRLSSRNQYVASVLNRAGIATLLADLLTEEEAENRRNVFDIALLSSRLRGLASWAKRVYPSWPVGYFGASTGGGAALRAAAESAPKEIRAVVSRGGRSDLAGEFLAKVRAPTLLIVGGNDDGVVDLNEQAFAALRCEKELRIVPGATHLFEEPGALEEVARVASEWFVRNLRRTVASDRSVRETTDRSPASL